MRQRIYLDHAAATPTLPQAREAMATAQEIWANPNSAHAEGRRSRALLEKAREAVKEVLGWRHDVIFTSGASEAVAIAAGRAKLAGRVFGATEHAIVPHEMGAEAAVVPVTAEGLIDLEALGSAVKDRPSLVAVQQVNNETGVIQPMDEIVEIVRSAGSLLLADCAQGAGKIGLPDADLIAVSAHKLGAPPGIGALLVQDVAVLESVGGQEKGYRRGTQDVPGAAAFAAALESRAFAEAMPRLSELRKRLEDSLAAAGGVIIAADAPRIATVGATAMPGASQSSLLAQFDLAGFAVSAGSACASGTIKTSPVLVAMGLPAEIASSAVRVSFGPSTSEAEVDAFVAEWRRIAERVTARAA